MSHRKPADENDVPQENKPRRAAYSRSMHRARSHESAHAEGPLPETKIPQHPLIPRNAAELVATQDGLKAADRRAARRGPIRLRQRVHRRADLSAQALPDSGLIRAAREPHRSVGRSGSVAILGTDLRRIDSEDRARRAQDVEPVVRHIGKSPANLFDTQIAAGFAGLSYPIALSRLVLEICGAKLGKGATFTHWDQRPLSPMQLRYAADDVRYLPAVYEAISQKLEARGHVEWNREECDAMCDASQYVFDPESQYLRVRGASTLAPQGLAILRELTIWRDSAAQEEDVPPRTLLKDEILLEMSRNPIRAKEKFQRVRGLPRPVEEHHGDAIIAATSRALALPPAQLPQQDHHEPSPSERFRAESVWAAAQAICTGQGIDPALATNRGEIVEFDRKLSRNAPTADHHLMKGWRRAALGQRLIDLRSGTAKFSLGWDQSGLRVAPE